MAMLKIPTNFNIDLEFEAPEFHRRMLSAIIDFIIQLAYLLLIFRLYAMSLGQRLSETEVENMVWTVIIIMVPGFLYHLFCELFMNGQSFGKKLLKIRVVNENGGRATVSQILIRFLMNPMNYLFLSLLYQGIFWAVFLMLIADIVMAVASRKLQRTGDILAHTILIRTDPKGSVQDTVFMEVSSAYVPVFPQIMQLSDRDINSIKGILDFAVRKGDYNLAETAAEKIKTHLGIKTNMSSFEFLETVMKDYNFLSTK